MMTPCGTVTSQDLSDAGRLPISFFFFHFKCRGRVWSQQACLCLDALKSELVIQEVEHEGWVRGGEVA